MVRYPGHIPIGFFKLIQEKLGLTWRQANKPSKANKAKLDAEWNELGVNIN